MEARRRPKASLIVAREILEDINSRGNQVGERLPSEELMAEQYGVGRATMREALRFLEFQGVISLKTGPGGGPTVRAPDGSSLGTAVMVLLQFSHAPYRTIVEARDALEPMICALAAQRLDDDEADQLRSSVERMAAHQDQEKVFLEENKRFHSLIAYGSGNAIFGHLINAFLGILDGTAIGIDYPSRRRAAVLEAHQLILDALVTRDSDKAAARMHDHLLEGLAYFQRRYPAVLDEPITWSHFL